MNRGKIAVVGGNQGALCFSVFAAEAGFDVTVFEKKKHGEVGYNWTDDVIASTFSDLGLPEPPEKVKIRPRGVTIVSPSKAAQLSMSAPEKEITIPVDRIKLANWLSELAVAAGAKIRYETTVERACVKNGAVNGVVLSDGEYFFANLVVDCGGVASVVRENLPDCLGIPQHVKSSETFFVKRSFYKKPEDSPFPKYTNLVYLKHLNEMGISWCTLSPDEKSADVLVGRLEGLSDDSYLRSFNDLKNENPIIGDKKIKGGQLLRIPVRYAISKMFADGYALVGDSAYMTIPMIGSGIANSMKAAKMLFETIDKPTGATFSSYNLYLYQKRYMEKIGMGDAVIDLVKNWSLRSCDGVLDYMLSEVLSETMLQITTGKMGKVPSEDIKNALKALVKNPKLSLELMRAVKKIIVSSHFASAMPDKYSKMDFDLWQRKYDAAFR